ncbi:conserved phage C-terminal domain-containing protein [Lacticaseibacillus hulanensis]|uniref:conserved phage C-terminal domain-containing protein n=1 Tax=Lacticaseibacillus hulanensis TaxID=2493111 RepID=UPI000FD6DFE6|nr:conserved phage C-terminal domain-containing protein [Lacticaseibacillus hulanensis]
MGKLIKPKRNGFTVASNSVIRDERLSWKARGIFLYLWSQPKDWDFYETEVGKHATDGRDSLRSGLKELEKYGYLKRKRVRGTNGQLAGSDWNIDDQPMYQKPMSDNPMYGEGTLLNTNQLSTNELNTNQTKEHSPAKAEPGLWTSVVDYLNSKADKHFKYTKATERMITARLKEGFTLDDCMTVIDNKVTAWGDDDKMREYIRPLTLFQASKFEGYLNETHRRKAGGESYGGVEF